MGQGQQMSAWRQAVLATALVRSGLALCVVVGYGAMHTADEMLLELRGVLKW